MLCLVLSWPDQKKHVSICNHFPFRLKFHNLNFFSESTQQVNWDYQSTNIPFIILYQSLELVTDWDYCLFVWLGFDATFNNILVILWQSVLLVEEVKLGNNWKILSHEMQVKHNLFLYGTKSGANSPCIGDRIQWSYR